MKKYHTARSDDVVIEILRVMGERVIDLMHNNRGHSDHIYIQKSVNVHATQEDEIRHI